jgi:hypothetical protein
MPLTHDFCHLKLSSPCAKVHYSLLALYSQKSLVSMKTPTFVFLDFLVLIKMRSLNWSQKEESFFSIHRFEFAFEVSPYLCFSTLCAEETILYGGHLSKDLAHKGENFFSQIPFLFRIELLAYRAFRKIVKL